MHINYEIFHNYIYKIKNMKKKMMSVTIEMKKTLNQMPSQKKKKM